MRRSLALTSRELGKYDLALAEFDKAATLNPAAWENTRARGDIYLNMDNLKGLAYLEMKSISQAQNIAVRLKAAIDKAPNKKLFRYYHYLTGMTELENKNYSKAVELFKLGLPLLNADAEEHLLFADALGTAFYKAGDLENARREYEKILSLGTGRLTYGDIYAKSYYRLGKISEPQGKKAEAAEHYRKFLSLWKDADPGLPEVEDARKRLTVFSNE